MNIEDVPLLDAQPLDTLHRFYRSRFPAGFEETVLQTGECLSPWKKLSYLLIKWCHVQEKVRSWFVMSPVTFTIEASNVYFCWCLIPDVEGYDVWAFLRSHNVEVKWTPNRDPLLHFKE